jgi:hypothetical protein
LVTLTVAVRQSELLLVVRIGCQYRRDGGTWRVAGWKFAV